VAITLSQVHEHCKPILERRNFRFRQLRGFVSGRTVDGLRLAKAFAHPGPGASNFMKALRGAKPDLKGPIEEEIRRLDRGKPVSHDERMLMVRRVQEIFLENGIHTDFNRPSSAGLVIRKGSVGETPVFFILGESGGSATFCGRYYEAIDGIGSRLTVNVTSTASRLVEILDLMFNEGRDGNDRLERALMLRDPESLRSWVSKVDFRPEEVPVSMFLFVMSVRESIRKLTEMAGRCDNPEDFVRAAVNAQLDAVLAHETSHILEMKANGKIPLPRAAKELIAYLLEAAYSSPDIAFRAMLDRKFRMEELMPGLCEDIRTLGGLALLEDSGFLQERAIESLDDIFMEISGKAHGQSISAEIIRGVQRSDYIENWQLLLVERAMCNPSLREI